VIHIYKNTRPESAQHIIVTKNLPEVLVDAVAQSSDYSLMHLTPPHSSLLLEELCDQDMWSVYSSPSTPTGKIFLYG
jgi:hypothetical protein